MCTRTLLIIGVAICAVVGISVGIYFATKSDDTSQANANNKPGNQTGNGDNVVNPSISPTPTLGPTPSPPPSPPYPDLPDPDAETYSLHALAIGDWGSTPGKPGYPGSCCNRYRETGTDTVDYYKDFWSQMNIAHMLSQSAAKLNPKVIIGHGDNFYWNGVGAKDVENRFHQAFESIYNQPSLAGIPWISVTGNHDMGGSSYICGEEDKRWRPCTSTAEMLDYLNQRFDLQSKYVSPMQNRWYMPGHYFKYSIQEGDISIDIFNVDTNFADSHGARQICCQCYGYSKGDDDNCNNVDKGDPYCMGGNIPMYEACMNQFRIWFEESLEQTAKDAKASTADWKIVNSHYSPHFHMAPPKREKWNALLRDHNIQVFMNGHTHGENHDFGAFNTHFFENGAGGGIQSETSGYPPADAKDVKNVWIGNNAPYGFFEISASKEWLKLQFITFAGDWKFSLNRDQIVKGSTKVDHCWYIPKDGSIGKPCAK